MGPRLNVRDLIEPVDDKTARWFRSQGWWREDILTDAIAANGRRTPDKVAIVGYHADGQSPEVLSYGQLRRLVDRFAGALLELGVSPGEVVSFQLPNIWQCAVLNLACTRIGAVANPIMPILRRREVSFILRKLESRVCIIPGVYRGFDYGAMLAQIQQETSTLEHVFVINGSATRNLQCFKSHFCDERWEDKHPPDELDSLRPDAEDPTEVMFTSGTTGEPKAVVQAHNSIDVAVRALAEGCQLNNNDVVLMSSPLGHQTGYLYGVCLPLKYGMKVVYQDVWDPDAMIRLVEDEGVTFTMGSTAFVLDACVAAANNPLRDVSSLRLFYSAGAPIPPHALSYAREKLGTKLLAGWGMTEIGLCTMTVPADPDDKVTSSDGAPLACVTLRIVDSDNVDLPAGREGRLLVRAPSQHLGYLGRDDLYQQSFIDGWFDTGDLARMNNDGYIRITGRTKDIVIRGGENIPVAEVEALLYTHPNVREVAVVAVPDDRLGERACAVVVPHGQPAPGLAELVAHLADSGMAKHFWPERLEVRDSLPKTLSGKIQKAALRDQLRGKS